MNFAILDIAANFCTDFVQMLETCEVKFKSLSIFTPSNFFPPYFPISSLPPPPPPPLILIQIASCLYNMHTYIHEYIYQINLCQVDVK